MHANDDLPAALVVDADGHPEDGHPEDGRRADGRWIGGHPADGHRLGALSANGFAPLDGGRHPLVDEVERLRSELAAAKAHADNLEVALLSNREIGAAIGILMRGLRVTYQQGFDLLRETSQRTNRKLRDVADDVLLTGDLSPDPGPS